MKNLNKSGFTLIELMVAIVIMGILVAVGVPKLTGAVSKSKATEVAPAATAYIKLQSAYVMERRQIGTWKRIGYEKPKSSVFEYSKGDITSKKAIADLGDGLVGWEATNKVGLGDCPLGKKWTVTIVNNGADDDGNFRLEYKGEVNHSACATISGDWGVVGGDITVAENEKPKETYKFVGNQVEYATREDGSYSFNKSLISADYGSDKKDWTIYGIEGYVVSKKGASGGTAALKDLVINEKNLTINPSVVVLTELYDVKAKDVSGSLAAGIYKAKQSLYYSKDNSIISSNLYGYRDVYVKYTNSSNIKYCYDEACTQIIDESVSANADDWDKSGIKEADDPFDLVSADMIVSTGTLSKSENSDLVSKMNAPNAVQYKAIDGVAGVVVAQDIASVSKPSFNEMNPSPTGADWGAIRVVSQIYAEEVELGHVYATTVSLYYGDKNTYELKDQRKLYVAWNDRKTGLIYFSDKECLNKMENDKAINKSGFWQSDIGKME